MKVKRELLGVEKAWVVGRKWERRVGERDQCVEMLSKTCYFVPCYYECQINYIVLLYLIIIYIMYYICFTFYSSELRLFYDSHMA